MTLMNWRAVVAAAGFAVLAISATAEAQSEPAEKPWSVEVGIGWDNGISGNINSSAIGELNNQVVVVTHNSYDNVYGTGLHLRFGGGYMLDQDTEVRGTFTLQTMDADFVTPMGDLGVSNLYGQFNDYQYFGLDLGMRQYHRLGPKVQAYGEGWVGIGFIGRIDVALVAPGANLAGISTDFYDRTAAFTTGAAAGVSYEMNPTVDFFGQLGLRWVTGLAQVDDLVGTGLEEINDNSSRWTLPLVVGVRFRF